LLFFIANAPRNIARLLALLFGLAWLFCFARKIETENETRWCCVEERTRDGLAKCMTTYAIAIVRSQEKRGAEAALTFHDSAAATTIFLLSPLLLLPSITPGRRP
jgi:hypothetical protein